MPTPLTARPTYVQPHGSASEERNHCLLEGAPCPVQGLSALPDDNEPSGHLLLLKHSRGTCQACNCCAGEGKGLNAKCSWRQQGVARLQRSLHCYLYLGDLQEVGLLRMLRGLSIWQISDLARVGDRSWDV